MQCSLNTGLHSGLLRENRMSQTEKKLQLNGREFRLIGTAHVSKESCEEVKNAVSAETADCVAIELDEQRYKSLNDREAWRKLDIVKVLRNHQGFLLLANLVLSGFQRRMGLNVGVRPGDEMRAGIERAQDLGIPVEMVDRPIQITLKRAWARNSLWGKCKLLATLITSAFSKEEVSGEEIESLKQSNEMDSMMSEISEYMPKVKEVLIDERDRYLACHIWKCSGDKVVAVLGAGHLPGVERHLNALAKGEESPDTTDIEGLPKKSFFSRISGWIFPAVIVGLIAIAAVYGGKDLASQLAWDWVIWNSSLSALGAVIARGHPLTVLVAAVCAPITSLVPVIGVGMFTGLIQAVIVRPKVSDMESVQDDVSSVKGFYRNRILRVLLVFILSTLGSAAGTLIASAGFVTSLWTYIKDACSSAWIWLKGLFA